MRFYNKTIASYRTNILVSHSIPQNHFRWNFSKRGSRGEHRQSRDWANKQQWTSQIRSNQICQHIKTTPIASKVLFKKLAITHHSIPFINTPINPSSNPSSPTLRSASGQGERPRRKPRVPDAPKIKHDKMKQFYMVDMRRKMWYYHLVKKMRIPLAREGKISLAIKNQTMQRMKTGFAEGWQTRGT